MNCAYCKVIEKGTNAVFEDSQCIALIVNKPAAPGHVVLMPKKHYPIMEQVPDDLMSHLFIVANRISAGIFEGLKSEGSNLIIQNGIAAGQTHPHFLMHLIPRKQGDGLDFTWKPNKYSEDDLATIENRIIDELSGKSVVASEENPDAEDYLIQQLERLP